MSDKVSCRRFKYPGASGKAARQFPTCLIRSGLCFNPGAVGMGELWQGAKAANHGVVPTANSTAAYRESGLGDAAGLSTSTSSAMWAL